MLRFLCALCAAGCILAQEQTPNDPKASDANTTDQKTDDPPDPDQTYRGPSILSREKSLFGERAGKLFDFRYYAEVTGIYDSGLAPLANNAQGKASKVGAAYGVETGFGAIASRRWKRDTLSVE